MERSKPRIKNTWPQILTPSPSAEMRVEIVHLNQLYSIYTRQSYIVISTTAPQLFLYVSREQTSYTLLCSIKIEHPINSSGLLNDDNILLGSIYGHMYVIKTAKNHNIQRRTIPKFDNIDNCIQTLVIGSQYILTFALDNTIVKYQISSFSISESIKSPDQLGCVIWFPRGNEQPFYALTLSSYQNPLVFNIQMKLNDVEKKMKSQKGQQRTNSPPKYLGLAHDNKGNLIGYNRLNYISVWSLPSKYQHQCELIRRFNINEQLIIGKDRILGLAMVKGNPFYLWKKPKPLYTLIDTKGEKIQVETMYSKFVVSRDKCMLIQYQEQNNTVKIAPLESCIGFS